MAPGTWAKKTDDGQWHSLVGHSIDVASCFEALLDHTSQGQHLATLLGVECLPPSSAARLTVLAFLHDFGKANARFQAGKGGHIREAVPILERRDWWKAAGLDPIEEWLQDPDDAPRVIQTVLAHHGSPPQPEERLFPSALWANPEGSLGTVESLVRTAQDLWPEAFRQDAPFLPAMGETRMFGSGGSDGMPRFWHAFLGLLQLSDWIGSDAKPDAFPYDSGQETPAARQAFARARARGILDLVGLNVSDIRRRQRSGKTFREIFGFEPTPMQREAGESVGPVVILESETGSGKTEAALWRFFRLFQAGIVDGLYFALPTRVAATQIHRRVQDAINQMFDQGKVEVLRALPGDAAMGEVRMRILPGFDVQWADGPDSARERARWAAAHPKRFLAAPVAVGTIDQALLAATRSEHAQMRQSCLARRLLVVDEVHASDFYMEHLLKNLLDQHVRAGGQALLLSATLSSDARTRLLGGKIGPDLAEATGLPYPALSVGGNNGRADMRPVAASGRRKSVDLEMEEWLDSPETIAEAALAAARAGAKVLVIRNTVGGAVATQRALEDRIGISEDLLLSVQGTPALHHGRFARSDRRLLDQAVEDAFGRHRPSGGRIAVGTQTLEQSLDIDADLLICDLAPIDVLLQRLGRLHRHLRDGRPEGFERPRAIVLTPETFDPALRKSGRGIGHGIGGYIYQDVLTLERTKALLEEGRWTIPNDNRRLVEAALHRDAQAAAEARLTAENPAWRDALMQSAGRRAAQVGAAKAVALAWQSPPCDFRPVESSGLTRLGARDLQVALAEPLRSPFPNGGLIDTLVIPAHLAPRSGRADSTQKAPARTFTDDGITIFEAGGRTYAYSRFGLESMSDGSD